METAKVDIRKLQVLNDRINQCIDALGQVRLSVHGLSHSGPQSFPGQAFASPYPQAGFGQQGSAPISAYGQSWGFGQGQSPFAGFSHSSPNPYLPFQSGFPQTGPYAQGWGQQSPFAGGIMHSSPNPYQLQQGYPQQGYPQQGYPQQGYPQMVGYGAGWGQLHWQPGLGLSHTSPESSGDLYSRLPLNDPFVATRITQTFPYLQYPQPPGLF